MINFFSTEFFETKGVLIAIRKAPTMTYNLLAPTVLLQQRAKFGIVEAGQMSCQDTGCSTLILVKWSFCAAAE